MTLLINEPGLGPGTHVLVIGVGAYPHLAGGSGARLSGQGGMRQLTSPPVSARAMATWFVARYRNLERPLRTLDLLVSDDASGEFRMPDGAVEIVERSTFANVEQAVKGWKARGDSDPGNLIILFFCGHGVARGLQLTLLLEDFGLDPRQPLNAAIDFKGLHLGLNQCAARNQLFLIDACRVASELLLTPSGFAGHSIYYAATATAPRQAPVFYATVPGASAYATANEASFFTDALLRALDGAGSDDFDPPGRWRIQTDALYRGIHQLLRRRVGDAAAADQLSSVDNLTRFAVHDLPGDPIVPVEVSCLDTAENPRAVLSYRGPTAAGRRMPPEAGNWHLDLGHGEYEFVAELQPPEHRTGSVRTEVVPPFRPIRIRTQ